MKGTVKGRGSSAMAAGIAWGTGMAMGVTCILSLLVAWMAESGVIGQDKIGYGSMAVLLTAALMGSMVAKGKVQSRRAAVSLVTGLCYFLCLLAVTAMCFGGQYTGIGVTGLLISGASGAAALVGIKGGRGGKRYRRNLPK